MKALESITVIWILGTIVTFAIAYYLWERKHKASAIAVIIFSPFPCPTGLPC